MKRCLFLKTALLVIMTVLLAAALAPTAVSTIGQPTRFDREIAPVGEITAESPFQLRLVITTGEFSEDDYGDQFEFEILVNKGLVMSEPLSWTAPAVLGVPCTTLISAKFSGQVDTCLLLVGVNCGQLWDRTGAYFVITPDSVEYWTSTPWAERGPRKRVKWSDLHSQSSSGHSRSSNGDTTSVNEAVRLAPENTPQESRKTQPDSVAEAEWRRMIEAQGEPFGPIKDIGEFNKRWEDSLKSLPLDHLWTIRFDLRDSVSRSIVESVLGEGVPSKRPGFFEYRVTQEQLDELDVSKNNIKWRLINEGPGRDTEPSDSAPRGESNMLSAQEESALAYMGERDRDYLFQAGWPTLRVGFSIHAPHVLYRASITSGTTDNPTYQL